MPEEQTPSTLTCVGPWAGGVVVTKVTSTFWSGPRETSETCQPGAGDQDSRVITEPEQLPTTLPPVVV